MAVVAVAAKVAVLVVVHCMKAAFVVQSGHVKHSSLTYNNIQ